MKDDLLCLIIQLFHTCHVPNSAVNLPSLSQMWNCSFAIFKAYYAFALILELFLFRVYAFVS